MLKNSYIRRKKKNFFAVPGDSRFGDIVSLLPKLALGYVPPAPPPYHQFTGML